MPILKLTTDQSISLGLMKKFVNDEIDRVFVLKGYAGTGKTTLIGELLKFMESEDIPFRLMASTGRAAKVMALKTGCEATTVHSYIYILRSNLFDESSKTNRVKFDLKVNNDPINSVYLIDEASMISNHLTGSAVSTFGSGMLLSDIFTFIQGRKVIFIGDPAQLPPINTLFSPALNAQYISRTFHLQAKEAFLYEVMRYDSRSGIGYNATIIRSQIENNTCTGYLKIKVSGFHDLAIESLDTLIINKYVSLFRSNGMHSVILLAYSNKIVNLLNQQIRSLLFPGKERLQQEDLIIVGQNNYMHNLSNGEQLRITFVDEEAEFLAGLTFRRIRYKLVSGMGVETIEHTARIIEEYLYRPKPGLTPEEEYTLMKDFIGRCYRDGLKGHKEEIDQRMMSDPYLNALRIRFGYAVTCHKAQGGEWPHVFLILEPMLFVQAITEGVFLRRWVYTALTRAEKNVSFLNNICLT